MHHLGKREAEADSQYVYQANTYAGYPYSSVYNNVYNTAGVYGGYTGYTGLTGYTYPYSTYGYAHHLGKRDADADFQSTTMFTTLLEFTVPTFTTPLVFTAEIFTTPLVFTAEMFTTTFMDHGIRQMDVSPQK